MTWAGRWASTSWTSTPPCSAWDKRPVWSSMRRPAWWAAGPTESLGQTWYEGSVTSVAIGQESTQVTPIQLTNYISTLVNGGTRYSTHLLKMVKSSDFSQVVYEYEPQVQGEINIAQENLDAVTEGMQDRTTGTGSLASAFQNLPFEVGAKTGSAQVSSTSDSNAV